MFKYQFLKFPTKIANFRPYCKPFQVFILKGFTAQAKYDECKKNHYPSPDGCYFTIWGMFLNYCAECFAKMLKYFFHR